MGLFAQMAYPDPVMTTSRPRLVILKGAVPLDSGQMQALRAAFDVVEVHSPAAAKKMLDGSVGGMVICAPGEYLTIGGEALPTAATTILERIGEGIGVVDSTGAVLWTDARLKMHDDQTRTEFVRLCRQALAEFNQPADRDAPDRRVSKRMSFASGPSQFELIVAPASLDQTQDRVMSVVGVMWEVTAARQLQRKLDAIDAAGADLLRIEPATVSRMNMADRLKLLEQKIIRSVRDILNFDNFEVRLLDRESGKLELVIAVNISPLRIGESMYARPEGNGISGYVAATGRSYICPDVAADPMYREGLDNAASSLTVPLMLQDRVIGTLNVESKQRNAFNESDRRFAEIFGRYVATAMNILDLLVVERYTTNEQLAANIVGELSQPLTDIGQQIAALQQAHADDPQLQQSAQNMMRSLERLRSKVQACTAGPRSILGAEQELHRQDRDPLIAGKSILIADDEPAIRDTLSNLLLQKGAQVTVCSSGAETIEALQSAAERGVRYDLIISDIKMPDCNGYEVYRTAKALNANLPVILMTGFGYDPHHCIVRASQEGLQSFLFKPFKASQLMEVISRLLAEAAR